MALGELGSSQKGVRVVRKQLEESGPFPVYQNSLMPLGYYKESNRSAGMPFVIGAGAAAQIGYSDAEWWAADDCFTFDIPQDVAVGRFVYYCLLNQQTFLKSRVRKASIPRLARSVVEKLRIPVPPVEVQRGIVRILDEYTTAHDELAVRIGVERAMRERQVALVRNQLLSFPEKEL